MPGLKPRSSPKSPAPQQSRKPRPHGFPRRRMAPTHRVEHAVGSCPDCGTSLSGGWTHRTREVIDLPRVPAQVTEHVFIARVCPRCRRPWEMLAEERVHLGGLPERSAVAPYLRDDRRVAHDGYVHWEAPATVCPGGGRERLSRWDSARGRWRSGRAPALGGASSCRTPQPALHRARPVGRVAQGRRPSTAGGRGSPGDGRRGGAALPGRLRAGCAGRCAMIALEQTRQHSQPRACTRSSTRRVETPST